jgi:hypothetical protein
MNLRDYMMSHPGQFTVAETDRPLTVDMLNDELLLQEEVTLYRVGQTADGRSKVHVYVRDHIHIATLIEGPSPAGEPSGQDSQTSALRGEAGYLH